MDPRLQRLLKEARNLGTDIVFVPQDRLFHGDGVYPSPFDCSLGIYHKGSETTLLVEAVDELNEGILGGICHELGHICASGNITSMDDEYDFFGWECALALKCGVYSEWLASCGDYGVGDGDEFGRLTLKQQEAFLVERAERAMYLGLVVDGEPQRVASDFVVGAYPNA